VVVDKESLLLKDTLELLMLNALFLEFDVVVRV